MRKTWPLLVSLVFMVLFACGLGRVLEASDQVSPAEARAIAREAYVYGFPLVDSYRILHAYFVDTGNPEYKAPFNTIRNMPRVYTPADTAIQTPNSDTPYSMLGMDLRAEPLVITIPAIEKNRYFSVQLIDAYTFNFDYIGSRATGNKGGSFLIAGPGWEGKKPKGITKVFHCETELALATFRTQLFNPEDIDNVKKIQAGYKIEPLSAFLGHRAPDAAPQITFPKPLSAQKEKTSLEFFNLLNFVLEFCPTVPSEKELMARFARIGIGAGRKIDVAALAPEMRRALADGMADAWKELESFETTKVDTGQVTSGDMFGTREFLENNYLYRFAATVLGIFGNSLQEAMYPIYKTDDRGEILDGSKAAYSLHFAADELPPVNAFWSVTMYKLPESLLVDNPINRYLINSPMLSDLKRDADGGVTIHIQHQPPGADHKANWLPAPDGPFMLAMRLYWPKDEALNGTWKNPPAVKKAQ